jgi:hypothetical protein
MVRGPPRAHVPEFRLAKAEIAKAEGQVVGVEFGEKPRGVAVGGDELHDGFEVEDLVLAVDRGALSAPVLEEFLALGGSDNCHVFDSCVGRTRSGPFTCEHGPRRIRTEANAGHQGRSSRDRESSRRDSGSALARRVRVKVLCITAR